jgi:hypothetical protein
LALFIPEIEQNRRICFRAKRKRLRIELPAGLLAQESKLRADTPRTGT